MTEKLSPLSTQTADPSQTLSTPTGAIEPAPAKDLPQKVEGVEEEPYTIKCICLFADDDGNTIFCETCETWQHIDCFYPDNREEALRENFAHLCHQCNPRPLDHKRAIERTRRLRNPLAAEESQDKKHKRPVSKSHKKKPKPTDLQLNGTTPDNETSKHASPSDNHPPAKRAKTSHRSSHSISSHTAKKSPTCGNAKPQTNGHGPSPVTTSAPDLPLDFEIHNYSDNFFSLHSGQDVQIVGNNSFATLAISNKMSTWLHDRESLKNDSGQEYKDVFQNLPADIESRKRALRVEKKTYSPTPDKKLRLQYLSAPSAIEKDVPLMELNGQIGFQNDYCADPENLWTELTSPLPFVFFHPMLPLCIDTRREGSEARYVRRSCKPNAVLDTYLSDGSEYHFWLVSDRHIAAKEQITLPWDFRFPNKEKARLLYLLGLGDDEMGGAEQPEMDDTEYQQISTWLHRLLSEYGGCACDLGNDCAFVRFHRHYLSRSQPRTNASKKKRKPKTQNISPTSTGHATNSRAASEGQFDDGDDRSISSRSKPPSRDRTPLRQGSFDQLGILTAPTDRDKRKIAMAEDTFRRMEQQHQPQPKKKKRVVSDGSASAKSKSGRTASNNTTPNFSNSVHYVDTGTSRSKSGSPATAISPRAQFPPFQQTQRDIATRRSRPTSTPSRPNYCDASVQTDPTEGEWFSASPDPGPRRRILSLSQRLLSNRHRQRLDEEERWKPLISSVEHNAMDIDSPTTDHKSASSSPVLNRDTTSTMATSPAPTPGDVAMVDAPSVIPGGTATTSSTSGAHDPAVTSSTRPDLRVHMPPVPAFPNTALSATTPLSATSSIVQSPYSTSSLSTPLNGMHPSPVKKKLSLSDYRKSRLDKAAAVKPLPTVKSGPEETKPPAIESSVEPQVDEKPIPDDA
ncbi:related to SET3 complex [Cephalotrichum gorgonifer]|uniref:Related to SET3 complex n=1 Tax=Cephalotrichum gorgonifer TaxID=2041049 RepID=A0AAE8N6P4_9PEZI|nr:related to SET3 complex [Cephalotrichum gorgonifer]